MQSQEPVSVSVHLAAVYLFQRVSNSGYGQRRGQTKPRQAGGWQLVIAEQSKQCCQRRE